MGIFDNLNPKALLSGAVTEVIKEAAGVVDRFVRTADEKAEAHRELQKIQADLERDMAAREAEIEKAYLADVDSARKMQMEALKQEDVFSKRFTYYFIIVWSLGAMGYIYAITFGSIPETSIRFADTILGFVLGTVIASFVSFLVGSSQGSKAKQQHMEKVTQDVLKELEKKKA